MSDLNTNGFGFKGGTSGGGGGSGTVTSVGLSLPAEFTVTGTPVTTSGTIIATKASQSANEFYGAPNGANGQPSFRAIELADLPEPARFDTYNFVGAITGGLAGRSAMIASLGAQTQALNYGVFNPAAFTINHTVTPTVAMMNIGAGSAVYNGTVYYELAIVPTGSINSSVSLRPVLGTAAPNSSVVSSTFTPTYGTDFTASSTTNDAITYTKGSISFTPASGQGSIFVFGVTVIGNTAFCTGTFRVFGTVKFVM